MQQNIFKVPSKWERKVFFWKLSDLAIRSQGKYQRRETIGSRGWWLAPGAASCVEFGTLRLGYANGKVRSKGCQQGDKPVEFTKRGVVVLPL